MAVGGDITELTINHPSLGSRSFKPKANEDNTYDLGGIRAEDDEKMIDTSGNMISKLSRKRGFLEVVLANDQNTREDADFITEVCESPELADYTWSIINGTTYSGKGRPVGDVQPNINAATFELKVAFQGKARKIAG